jgi:hypothetical protein
MRSGRLFMHGFGLDVSTIGREVQDTAGYAFRVASGPVTIAKGAAGLADTAGDIIDGLDEAAEQYDNAFGFRP